MAQKNALRTRGKKLATVDENVPVSPLLSSKPVVGYKIIHQEIPIEVKSLQVLTRRMKDYLPAVLSAIEEGFECPLEVFTMLKAMQSILESVTPKVQLLALTQAQQYTSEELQEGFGLERGNSPEKWDYAQDSEYQIHDAALKARKTLLKKAVDEGKEWLDEKTGELISPVPLKTASTPYLKKVSKK
ncbi:hypothetical protein [Microscilla marina]|uniref:Uncharacterized protein n=1 Tax=Microscilla marina ATCC 23134 TaxID=313606 RepID=A1ZJY9_MICM2|nr:hypothetical protein [Microscilla marina]EAY29442.1 hypothetical protein M23134_01502 [Microscilla marina ATCC 23134]